MFGAASPLKLSRPAAAKTGTTDDFRDNWTVGFTRYLVAGVWAGNTDGRPMKNVSGVAGAAPIWHDFMEGVLADKGLLEMLQAPEDPDAWQFVPPPDVKRLPDCPPGVTCRAGGEFFSANGWRLPARRDRWLTASSRRRRRRSTPRCRKAGAGRPTAGWSRRPRVRC